MFCSPRAGQALSSLGVMLLAAAVLLVLASGCGPANPVNSETPAHRPAGEPGRTDVPDPASRGKVIYTQGRSPSATPITAVLGEGPALPATALTCANCH